jgi:dihydrofolate reductase
MARLIYSAITSLDGYVADVHGKFDWSEPDEEVHTFVNDLERPIGIYLYGRRMYEVMVYWGSTDRFKDAPSFIQDYARIWQAADKVVYSTTLDSVSSAKTRIAERFDPNGIRQLKDIADRDISIGGADLAGQAMKAGLVDDYHVLVSPVVVGGGHKALPDDIHMKLQLQDHRSFDNGVVHLHYQLPPKDEWPSNGELANT